MRLQLEVLFICVLKNILNELSFVPLILDGIKRAILWKFDWRSRKILSILQENVVCPSSYKSLHVSVFASNTT